MPAGPRSQGPPDLFIVCDHAALFCTGHAARLETVAVGQVGEEPLVGCKSIVRVDNVVPAAVQSWFTGDNVACASKRPVDRVVGLCHSQVHKVATDAHDESFGRFGCRIVAQRMEMRVERRAGIVTMDVGMSWDRLGRIGMKRGNEMG